MSAVKTRRVYHCARCGRILKIEPGKYVYSTFTGQRYCLVGHCKARKVVRDERG